MAYTFHGTVLFKPLKCTYATSIVLSDSIWQQTVLSLMPVSDCFLLYFTLKFML